MSQENRDYLQLAGKLVEEFYKKQSAGLLSNLNKRNVDELTVSREKIIKDIREQYPSIRQRMELPLQKRKRTL